jgi:glutathione S-transferase
MPIDPAAPLEITAFEWVPEFAQGFVRDLRLRWACEEAGLAYRERLINAVERPQWYFAEQPWGQVPALRDGDIRLFESGAILLYLGEGSETLLPREPQPRADTIAWLFAALNTVEPCGIEFANLNFFGANEEWARLRRPSLEEFIARRLAPLEQRLAGRDWLTGGFTIADIAMVTVLRELADSAAMRECPALAAYIARGLARPAFERALADQLAPFSTHAPQQPTENDDGR